MQPVKIYSNDYNDTIKLNVFCIDKCNYNCKYCVNMKGNYIRTNKELDLNKVFEFSIWLNKKTNKKIKISLIGGEPTLHSQFIEFSQKIYSRKDIFTILSFTNFAKSYEFFEETLKNNVQYLLTFHILNEHRTIDFMKKLDKIDKANLSNNIDTINVMLLKECFDKCIQIYDNLYIKYGQKVRCNLIDDYDKDNIKFLRFQNYTQEQLNDYDKRCKISQQDKDNIVIYDNGIKQELSDYEIKNNINFNFKFWKCNAGKDYFNIDVDGNIWPCNDMKIKKLGTLDIFKHIKFSPTICCTAKCPCEYGLTKQKIFKCQ